MQPINLWSADNILDCGTEMVLHWFGNESLCTHSDSRNSWYDSLFWPQSECQTWGQSITHFKYAQFQFCKKNQWHEIYKNLINRAQIRNRLIQEYISCLFQSAEVENLLPPN